MASHTHIPAGHRKRKWGGQQTEPKAFHARSPGQERTGGFLLPDWPLLLSQGVSAPPAGLPALFN